ncbi:hypothetical protein C7B64_03920 [Merismopedia glauca CCAP 1448/3]|uniref:Uncharacterized protein n=2 Tax=Merismopedia TaxID=53402 RepID=A0A2T1C869_9CYAN|nr:hypothetical protein C7B64_03920 [Merismopedia glauca CCAP 1448/3]
MAGMFYIGYNFGLVALVLLVFGILQWMHIPAGRLIDWVIAVAIFEWLLVIVTVPWNIYFEAKQVLADAEQSNAKQITIDRQQVEYAKTIAQRSLVVAITLHLLSAIGLYGLAITGISVVGYISSGAALLLTVLRPAVRTYEYLAVRLAAIRQEFKYPREDIMELRDRFSSLENSLKSLENQLNPEISDSWVAIQQRYWEENRQQIAHVGASLAEVRATNNLEHEKLSREARNAIAQITDDGQFLEHVREILRFFKNA